LPTPSFYALINNLKNFLAAGDVLIEFAGRKVAGLDDFDLALRRFSSGDTIEVTVTRAGKPVTLKVTLGVARCRSAASSPLPVSWEWVRVRADFLVSLMRSLPRQEAAGYAGRGLGASKLAHPSLP
jgi:hypothetical protein